MRTILLSIIFALLSTQIHNVVLEKVECGEIKGFLERLAHKYKLHPLEESKFQCMT